jgi:hypothetical protein
MKETISNVETFWMAKQANRWLRRMFSLAASSLRANESIKNTLHNYAKRNPKPLDLSSSLKYFTPGLAKKWITGRPLGVHKGRLNPSKMFRDLPIGLQMGFGSYHRSANHYPSGKPFRIPSWMGVGLAAHRIKEIRERMMRSPAEVFMGRGPLGRRVIPTSSLVQDPMEYVWKGNASLHDAVGSQNIFFSGIPQVSANYAASTGGRLWQFRRSPEMFYTPHFSKVSPKERWRALKSNETNVSTRSPELGASKYYETVGTVQPNQLVNSYRVGTDPSFVRKVKRQFSPDEVNARWARYQRFNQAQQNRLHNEFIAPMHSFYNLGKTRAWRGLIGQKPSPDSWSI